MKLTEVKGSKISFWDAVELLGLDDSVKFDLHDKTIPWINNNSERSINTAVKNKDYVLMSKLMLFKELQVKNPNYSDKTFTLDEFKRALNEPITLWRGGGGTFDLNHVTKRTWVPFTAKQSRVATFTEYDGTFASKAVFLPTRKGSHWVIELKCNLNDILLYLPHGGDEEVIVPKALLKQAKVIKQT